MAASLARDDGYPAIGFWPEIHRLSVGGGGGPVRTTFRPHLDLQRVALRPLLNSLQINLEWPRGARQFGIEQEALLSIGNSHEKTSNPISRCSVSLSRFPGDKQDKQSHQNGARQSGGPTKPLQKQSKSRDLHTLKRHQTMWKVILSVATTTPSYF